MDTAARALALATALAPALLFGAILCAIGRRTLPSAMITTALSMGTFAGIASLFAELPLAIIQPHFFTRHVFLAAFAVVAPVEEAAKLAVLLLVVLRNVQADLRRDAILAGAWVGVGFGAFENLLHLIGNDTLSPSVEMIEVLRLITAAPFHIALGAIAGWLLAIREERRSWLAALAVAIFLHALYDWPLFGMTASPTIELGRFQSFGAIFVLTLAGTGYLLCRPVADRLRAIAVAPPAHQTPLTSGRLFRALNVLSLWLRVLAVLPFWLFCVLAIWKLSLLPLVATPILPFAFGELWRYFQQSAPAETA